MSIDDFLNSSWLQALMDIIWNVIVAFIKVIMFPIDALINAFMPNFNSVVAIVHSMYTYAGTYITWLINATGITATALSLIAGYIVFRYTTTLVMWLVKVVTHWVRIFT